MRVKLLELMHRGVIDCHDYCGEDFYGPSIQTDDWEEVSDEDVKILENWVKTKQLSLGYNPLYVLVKESKINIRETIQGILEKERKDKEIREKLKKQSERENAEKTKKRKLKQLEKLKKELGEK